MAQHTKPQKISRDCQMQAFTACSNSIWTTSLRDGLTAAWAVKQHLANRYDTHKTNAGTARQTIATSEHEFFFWGGGGGEGGDIVKSQLSPGEHL